MPYAFKHNRAFITDGVERFDPRFPIDGTKSGGKMRISSPVVVVNVGGEEEFAGGLSFLDRGGNELSVAGVDRDGEIRTADFSKNRG